MRSIEINCAHLAVNDRFIWDLLKCSKHRVDEDGNLWTRRTINGNGILKNQKWRICGTDDGYGYRVYKIACNGRRRKLAIHRIVYAAKMGELDSELVINHKDSNRSNNHISNLELVSILVNNQHRSRKTVEPFL